MKALPLPLVFLLSCADPSPLAGGPATAEDKALTNVLLAFDAGDCAQVITLVEGLHTSTDLRLMTAEILYGRCLSQTGNDEAAVLVLSRVADSALPSPTVATALYYRGRAHRHLAEHAEAAADFSRIADRFPHHHLADDARYYLGRSHFDRGELSAAKSAFEAVLLMPRASHLRHAGATYRLGLTLLETASDATAPELELAWRRFAEVLSDYSDTIYADDAAYRQGRVRFAEQRYDEAEQLLSAFRETHPDSVYGDDALYYAARCRDERGELEGAIALYREVEAAGTSLSDDAAFRAGHAALTLAEASGRPEDYAAAEIDLARALETYPSTPWMTSLAYDLGRARYALERFSAAIEAFAKVVAVPTSVFADNAVYYTGRCWYRIAFRDAPDSYHVAITWFLRLLSDYPTSSYADDATYFEARALFELGEFESAAATFESLVLNFPESNYLDDALRYLTLSELALGDCDKASEALDRMRTLASSSPFLSQTEATFALRCDGGTP